jgi:hypothetical protein
MVNVNVHCDEEMVGPHGINGCYDIMKMRHVLSNGQPREGFAVLSISSVCGDDANDMHVVPCTIRIDDGATADAVNRNSVDEIPTSRICFQSANCSSKETQSSAGNCGEAEPTNRHAYGQGSRSWEEWYDILLQAKSIWDKQYRTISIPICEYDALRRLKELSLVGGDIRNTDGLKPLIRMGYDMSGGSDADQVAIIVIKAQESSSTTCGSIDMDDVRANGCGDLVPIHLSIVLTLANAQVDRAEREG